jgi:hypothetical protein
MVTVEALGVVMAGLATVTYALHYVLKRQYFDFFSKSDFAVFRDEIEALILNEMNIQPQPAKKGDLSQQVTAHKAVFLRINNLYRFHRELRFDYEGLITSWGVVLLIILYVMIAVQALEITYGGEPARQLLIIGALTLAGCIIVFILEMRSLKVCVTKYKEKKDVNVIMDRYSHSERFTESLWG